MEMCYDGAFVMPSNYAVMDEDEMMYVEGGVSLKVNIKYLNKTTCKNVAKSYVGLTGLSQMRIAKEIYAHAFMYYASPTAFGVYSAGLSSAIGMLVANATLLYIRNHAKSY